MDGLKYVRNMSRCDHHAMHPRRLTVGTDMSFCTELILVVVQVEAGSHAPAVVASCGQKLKIFAVEDHAPNRLLLCQQLE